MRYVGFIQFIFHVPQTLPIYIHNPESYISKSSIKHEQSPTSQNLVIVTGIACLLNPHLITQVVRIVFTTTVAELIKF